MRACSNTDLRIIPSQNWVILKASFSATNCSLKWHISSDNKPFLADHPQTQLKPCLLVQSWLLTSGGQLSEFSVYSTMHWPPAIFMSSWFLWGKILFISDAETLSYGNLLSPQPYHLQTLQKSNSLTQAASWSFCWGNIRTQLRCVILGILGAGLFVWVFF